MTPYILLGAGLVGLSFVITYAWWCRFRVWVLRQDLFEIRDRLWDEAMRCGFIDDPAHRDARDAINAMIRFCPRLSVPVWNELKHIARGKKEGPRISKIAAVEKAWADMALCITRYVFLWSAYGLMFLSYGIIRKMLFSSGSVNKLIARKAPTTRRIAQSEEMVEIDREYQQVESRRGGRLVGC